jgi:hypothetical protein
MWAAVHARTAGSLTWYAVVESRCLTRFAWDNLTVGQASVEDAAASGQYSTLTQFNIATNDYRSGSEKSEYHTVVTWH